MFLNKPSTRLSSAAKARLNSHPPHSHKLDNIEPRKRSPENNLQQPSRNHQNHYSSRPQNPPSPSEILVFNNSHQSGGGNGRNLTAQMTNTKPEVPQAEEIAQYFRDTWDAKMHQVAVEGLTILHLGEEPPKNGPIIRNNSLPNSKSNKHSGGNSRKM